MALTTQQKNLLVGTLLGDGNLQTETFGRTWRYRALQKAAHLDYLVHKYEILKPLCQSPPIFGSVFDPRTEKTYQRWSFNTVVSPSLRYYGNLFYTFDPKTQSFKKDVPKNIEKLLTPQAIAYWYMDDGALKWKGKSNAMRICTESFSKVGINRLTKGVKKLYGIEMEPKKHNRDGVFVGYRLAINEENSTQFRELIRPYLVKPMNYKVSNGKYGSL